MENISLVKRSLWVAIGLTLILGACSVPPSPSPEPTATATLVEPTDTPTQVVSPTSTPEPTATPTRVVPPTSTPEPTATPTEVVPPTAPPTETAPPTNTPTATPTATPTQTPEPTATPTSTPEPTATTVPTRVVPPTATPTPIGVSADWLGEYYANIHLSGSPVMVRSDASVGFDWQEDPPAPGLPADEFSVRWTRVAWFDEGTYDFHAAMDDGMRVYVDDEQIIDEWRDESERKVTASRYVAAGEHAMRVEYYDRRHGALANVWWENQRPYPDWKGVYWANPHLLGQPALLRNDPQIGFDWQTGSPGAPVPNDRFSARWTRTGPMEEGIYRFQALVDDGLRLWVDDVLVIDAWQDQQSRALTADYVIAGTVAHTIRVEYYDNMFDARVHVSVEKVGAPSYPYWKGEYFGNPYLGGEPILVRSDRSLNFDWEDRAPAPGLPADGFSVRWTREREFEPGVYRFQILADDGVRFYVGGERVLNEWHNAWGEVYEVDVTLPWKTTLELQLYEDAGDARIRFSWERIR